jgi:hypothetical protein
LWLKLPVLFDISTLVLLAGGCLLLWRNLGARSEEVLPTISDPEADESLAPRAEPFETKQPFETKALSEPSTDNGAGLPSVAPAQESDAQIDAVSTDQNHYASSVSAAIAKSRKTAARV